MTQDPTDLPSGEKPRQWQTETYAESPATQLHSILEDELERQRARLGGANW